nr:reverse transcriptase domain-containing protein [Tanacetum cinerariifolium]
MDSIILLGQKNTLAEYMILSGADNRPSMLDKDLYDSWKSRMELYMQNREHIRMILASVENDPLIWPTVEEIGVTRTKKYVELSAAEKIQADCDMKVADIILQAVASLRFPSTNNQLRTSSNPRNHATIQDGMVTVHQVQGRQGQSYSGSGYKSNATSSGGTMQADMQGLLNDTTVKVKDIWLGIALSLSDQGMHHDPGVLDSQAVQTIIPNNAAFQTGNLNTYDSDCDDILNAQVVLMANIFNYGSDIISEVPHSKTYLNHMENQRKANKEQHNESVTAELERYKERVKTFKQRLNIDLSSWEKMIDYLMDDMIREKLALKEQVDSLEQNLSKQIIEKECLLQTFTVFKNESKEKEGKYMENKIDLEKKVKELDYILFKVGQSAQTVHMLTKPQAFYDNIHKQVLGYQNPSHLKRAQRIKPTLYDGIVMSAKHVAMRVIDDEETLILEEKSLSKKAKIVESKNANHLEPNHTWGSNATDIPSSSSLVMTVRFENNDIARIIGYGDHQLGNVTISRFKKLLLRELWRHMTENMSYLFKYEEIDGGYVAFGGDPKGGKITSKGKISTDKLDFEDVYFVKELKFNLFSVSQMCDKKNSVLFTDTGCVVLSPDFKLLDKSHVLLKVPRNNNMYNVDLKNVAPQGESPLDTMADQRTMAELLRAPTEGYAEAIVVPPIPAEHFELKYSLINMMTSDQFFGLEKDNPHDHIRWFNKITSTIKYKDVPNSAIKLMLFPFSLARAARRWLKKEPPRSILTWEDLVSKFINEFFPPSRTENLRNEISNFQQRFDESFHEAWDRYKDLLRACPHHGFAELHQLDTFYNALNPADQDSLNSAAGGNLLERRTQDVLTIIEKNPSVVTTAMTVILKQFQATPPPASVKAVEEICVTCGGAHPYYQCLTTDGNSFPEFQDNIQGYVSAAAVNYN